MSDAAGVSSAPDPDVDPGAAILARVEPTYIAEPSDGGEWAVEEAGASDLGLDVWPTDAHTAVPQAASALPVGEEDPSHPEQGAT